MKLTKLFLLPIATASLAFFSISCERQSAVEEAGEEAAEAVEEAAEAVEDAVDAATE